MVHSRNTAISLVPDFFLSGLSEYFLSRLKVNLPDAAGSDKLISRLATSPGHVIQSTNLIGPGVQYLSLIGSGFLTGWLRLLSEILPSTDLPLGWFV